MRRLSPNARAELIAALKLSPLEAADRLQWQAHWKVREAVLSGVLPRLDGTIACTDCHKPACEYDHREYARPLDVAPVCHRCNIARGAALEMLELDRLAVRLGCARSALAWLPEMPRSDEHLALMKQEDAARRVTEAAVLRRLMSEFQEKVLGGAAR